MKLHSKLAAVLSGFLGLGQPLWGLAAPGPLVSSVVLVFDWDFRLCSFLGWSSEALAGPGPTSPLF